MQAEMSPVIAIDQSWNAFALITQRLMKKVC
jgi:hypothetical protein